MSGIEVTNLTKKFGDVTALDNISLTLPAGKIYGLLGRNGAGKSTLLNILTNRIFADHGVAKLDGESVSENNGAIGKIYMMSVQNLYPESMKVEEAFRYAKHFYPNFDPEEADRLSKFYNLPTKKKIKSLSTGYQSLFKLIMALSTNAEYLFLDEPVLGLDANNRDSIYKHLIEKFVERNSTILLSTHIIEEISGMIEEVIIIHEGKIKIQESAESLLGGFYQVSGSMDAVDAYGRDKIVIRESGFGGLKSIIVKGEPDSSVIENVEISRPNLQDLFIYLTTDENREERSAS